MKSASLLEKLDLGLDSRESAMQGVFLNRGVSAVSLAILMLSRAPVAVSHERLSGLSVRVGGSQGTAQTLETESFDEAALIRALAEFHDRLLASQEEFDAQAREILDANLWQLYG